MSHRTTTIKTNILRALDRVGDTNLDENLWFTIAHRDIQRVHNFRCMQESLVLSPVVDSLILDIVADSYKDSEYIALISTTTGFPTEFYKKTTYANLLDQQFNRTRLFNPLEDVRQLYYAVYNGFYYASEMPTAAMIAENSFAVQGWSYLDDPSDSSEEEDWFTKNAEDYLMYRSLIESVPYLGASSEKLKLWTTLADRAQERVVNADIEATHSGSLQIPG